MATWNYRSNSNISRQPNQLSTFDRYNMYRNEEEDEIRRNRLPRPKAPSDPMVDAAKVAVNAANEAINHEATPFEKHIREVKEKNQQVRKEKEKAEDAKVLDYLEKKKIGESDDVKEARKKLEALSEDDMNIVKGWATYPEYDVDKMLEETNWTPEELDKYADAYRAANKNSYLSEEETYQYMGLKIKSLDDEEKKLIEDYWNEDAALYTVGREGNVSELMRYFKNSNPDKWTDEKIKEYADYIQRLSNKNREQYSNEFWYGKPGEQSIGQTIWATVDSLNPYKVMMGGLEALTDLQSDPNGLGADMYTSRKHAINSKDYARQTTSQTIAENHPNWAKVYDIATSAAESAETVLIGGAVGKVFGAGTKAAQVAGEVASLTPFATSAYNSKYKEARARGLSIEDAEKEGFFAALIEAGTEKIPFDNFLKFSGKAGKLTAKKYALEWLKESGLEGLEEVVGDVANRMVDYAIADGTGLSEMEIATQQYMDQGYSEEEAKSMAEKDFWLGVAEDFGAGAASGSLLTGATLLSSSNRSQRAYAKYSEEIENKNKKVAENSTDTEYGRSSKEMAERFAQNPTAYIAENIDDSTPEGKQQKEFLQKYADKVENGGKLTRNDKMNIVEVLQDTKQAPVNMDNFFVPDEYKSAVTNVSVEEGRKAIQDAIKAKDQDALGKAYRDMSNSTSVAARNSAKEAMEQFTGMAQNAGLDVESAMVGTQEAYMKGLRGENFQSSDENLMRAFTDGELKRTNETKTRTINSVNDLKTNVETSSGVKMVLGTFNFDGEIITNKGTIKADDIIEDTAVRKAYQYASQKENIIASNAFMRNIKDGENIDTYNSAFNYMYSAGASNQSFEQATKEGFLAKVSEHIGLDRAKVFWELGRNEYTSETKKTQDKALGKVLGIKEFGSGVVIDSRTDKSDTSNMEFLNLIAKFMGKTNINVVDDNSKIFNKGDNAKFVPSESTIYVRNGNLKAVFHELAELTDFYNSKGYETLRQSAMEWMSKDLGNDKFNFYLNGYKDVYSDEGHSYLDASREMVNDYIVAVLKSGKGSKALAERLAQKMGAKEARTFGQKLKNWISNVKAAIQKLFGDSQKATPFMEEVTASVQNAEEVVNAFVDVLEEATKVQEAASKGELKGDAESDAEVRSSKEMTDKYMSENDLGDFVYAGTHRHDNRKIAYKEGNLKFISNRKQLEEAVEKYTSTPQNGGIIPYAKVSAEFSDRVNKFTKGKHDTTGMFWAIVPNDLYHAFKEHSKKDSNSEGSLDMSKTQLVNGIENANQGIPIRADVFKDGAKRITLAIPSEDGVLIMADVYSKSAGTLSFKTAYRISPEYFEQKYRSVTDTAAILNKVSRTVHSDSTPINRIEQKSPKSNTSTARKSKEMSASFDSEGNNLTEQQTEFFKDSKVRDDNGNLKVVYHGTARADRVGYIFDPNRATSGPMAYFTDNKEVATNYSRDKQDTSLSRDSDYDSYYTQFKMNVDGKDMSIAEAWDKLPISKRVEIRKKAPHVTFDDEYENIIYDENRNNGLGNFDKYLLREHHENYLEALVDAWLEQGDLYGQESRFKEVLSLVGLDDVQYLDPDYREEKVYETYLNITNPLRTQTLTNEFADELEEWWKNADQSKYDVEDYAADMWDKTSINVDRWISRLREDIAEGTTHSWTTIPDAVTDFLKEKGYDGIEDKGGKNHETEHTVYIPFYSEQIKDVNNENPTENIDIRYSKEMDSAFEFMLDWEEANEYASILEDGAKEAQALDERVVKGIANKLRKEIGSKYDADLLAENLQKAFNYMATNEHVNYADMMRIFKEIATPVVEEVTEKVGEEEYRRFVNEMKGYKIALTESQMAEVKKVFGSYAEFKKRMSPLTISNNGVSLDSVWNEMVEASGYILDMDATSSDMPTVLYDTLQAMKPAPKSVYGGNVDDVAKDVAMRIVEEYLTAQNNTKAAEKIRKRKADVEKKLKEEYREKLKNAKQSVIENKAKAIAGKAIRENNEANREQNLARIAEIKARYKGEAQRKNERAEAEHQKRQIESSVKRLTKWIQNPTEKNHVPVNMVDPILDFTKALDFVMPDIKKTNWQSGTWSMKVYDHSITDGNGRRKPIYTTIEGQSRNEVILKYYDMLNEGRGSENARNWQQRMQKIVDLYNQARTSDDESNLGELLDTSLAAELKEVMKSKTVSINNLTSSELKVINNVLKNLENTINKQNAMLTDNKEITEIAKDTMNNANNSKVNFAKTQRREKLWGTFFFNMATPETFMHGLGEGAERIYKSIRKGFNTFIQDVKQAQDFMKETMLGVSKSDLKKWSGAKSEVHHLDLSDGHFDITTAQIMSLYELNKRDQTLSHYKGGVMVERFNHVNTVYNKDSQGIHLKPEDLAKLFSYLTPKQIEIADKLQKYMATECAKQGNEVSRKMYGFEKFNEEHYFPLTTDRNYISTNNANDTTEGFNKIEKSGFTKKIIENASNPIIIKDIFDVFTDHVSQMASYHGYAPALKDAMRWYNYTEIGQIEDSEDLEYSGVKSAINKIYGKNGQSYFTKFIKDINQVDKSQYIGNFTDKLISGYKASAVAANMRVVIQQPTAYFRAANLINPVYLTEAMLPQNIAKYSKWMSDSEIAQWKSWGYYETSIGKSLKEIVTGQNTFKDKITNAAMTPAGVADDLTWRVLYTATALEQKAKNKGLSESELREKIKDRFDEMIDQTQVVDSTLHRSQYMRSKDTLNKLQTAFMAEPTKSYNMILRAWMDDYKNGGIPKKSVRAFATFAVTSMATAAAAALVDGLRKTGDDDDYEEVYRESLIEGFLDNINPFNLMPVFKDVSSTVINMITGESSFGNSSNRMDLDAINELVDALDTAIKWWNGDSNKTVYGLITTIVRPFSQMTGIPAYNLQRDLVSIYNQFGEDLKKTIEKPNDKYLAVYKSIAKDDDIEVIKEKVNKAMEKEGTIKDVRSGINSRYKSDYYEALLVDEEEAKAIAELAKKGLIATDMTEEEANEVIKGWEADNYGYSSMDKAIASGEGIEEAMNHILQTKKKDNVIKHIIDRYADTFEYNDRNALDSELDERVEEALNAIGENWNTAKKAYDDLQEAKAEAKEAQEAKTNAKENFYNVIQTGNGDYKSAIEDMIEAGTDYKTIKSNLSSDQTKPLIKAYYNGDKNAYKAIQRIVTVRAYLSQQMGTKIAKKYHGDYLKYENDQVKKLMAEYEKNPW